MTIYNFPNQKTNTFFICTEPTLEIPDYLKDKVFFLSEDEAQALCKQAQNELLIAEASRFNINEEIADGSNTTWQVADLSKGSEESIYQIFNPAIGTYDRVIGVTLAEARQNELKQNLLDSSSLHLIEINEFPKPLAVKQPKSSGTQII